MNLIIYLYWGLKKFDIRGCTENSELVSAFMDTLFSNSYFDKKHEDI